MNHKYESQLEQILTFIRQQQLLQKPIMTLAEAAEYSGLSRSFLYKKTASREIKFYRLHQKLLFFKREDLDAFLLSNPQPTVSEIADCSITQRGMVNQPEANAKCMIYSRTQNPTKS